MNEKPNKYQFTIRFLMGVTLICALSMGLLKLYYSHCKVILHARSPGNFTRVKHIDGVILKLDKNIESLVYRELENNHIPPFEGLVNLKQLAIYCKCEKLEEIKHLKSLEAIYLQNSNLSDLYFLSKNNQLNKLFVQFSEVSNLEPLSNHLKLQYLNLLKTKVTDLKPISKLKFLKELRIRESPISDLSPLANLKNLELLDISFCQVKDVSPLFHMTSLKQLGLDANQISEGQIKELKAKLPDCEIITIYPEIGYISFD